MATDGNIFKCPTCGKPAPDPSHSCFPFCSDRCRLIDLGNWVDGKYTVARPLEPDEELGVPPPPTSSHAGA